MVSEVFFFVKKKRRKILKGTVGTTLQELNLGISHQLSFAFQIPLIMNAWRARIMCIVPNILLVYGSWPDT